MKPVSFLRSSISMLLALTVLFSAAILPVPARAESSPSVVSILRVSPSPSNLASVNYTVTFSEDVQGVDPADFSLTRVVAGTLSGESVTSVSGGPVIYTVSVNSGSGDGELRLDVPASATVTDVDENGLIALPYISGESYTFDRTAPAVVSSVRANPNPTRAASVNYTVTFSEPVMNAGADDFSLMTTGTLSGASVSGVSGGPSIYTVSVNTGSGDGELRLGLPVSAAITDLVGNAPTAAFATGESYTVDKTMPEVLSTARAGVDPTNAAVVDFTVTFAEPVSGVDVADFESCTAVSGGPTVYTVSVSTSTGDNYLRLVVPVGATVSDLAGNMLTSLPIMIGEPYHVDRLAPTVVSSVRASANPSSSASVNFTVTFSEPVTSVEAGDFSLTATGTLSGTSVTGASPVGESQTVYTVGVNSGTGEGSLRLDLPTGAAVTDIVGNALASLPYTSGESYTIDRTAPTVVSSMIAAAIPGSVDFTVTFSEDVKDVESIDFSLTTTGTLSGVSITTISGGSGVYTVRVGTGTGAGSIRLDVPATAAITDWAGLPLTGLPYISGAIFTVDRLGPTVVSVLPALTNGDFVVTFSEPVQGVEANDFVLVKTGDISGESITNVVCLDNICLVVINTGTGEGSLRLDVPLSATITDRAGMPLTKLPYTTGKRYTIKIEAFRSTGSGDGWMLESGVGSRVGGSANSTDGTFNLGDDGLNRQYRAMLHFPTFYLPDNAVVIQADLMIKKQSEFGATFNTFGNIAVDIRNGLFVSYHDGGFGALQPKTFEAQADAASVGGSSWNHNATGWYWTALSRDANPFISLNGGTQIRLGYQTATNMNGLAEYVRFYSGDHESQKDRPHLQIRYCVPG